MVKNASAKGSSGSAPECTSCKGLLYLSSSSKKDTDYKPLCVGLTRQVGDIAPDVVEHAKALHHFKYACLGYSTHRNNKVATTSRADLPKCSGLEILIERQAVEAAEAAKQGHLKENSQRGGEGPRVMPRPPSAIRPPSGNTGVSPEEFGTRFIRSAGLVAAGIKKDLSHLGNSIKQMVGDIFHSDGGGSK